jgi:heptosyltransferase-2
MTRVLIIPPPGVGELVLCQSLVACLLAREPDVAVDMLVEAPLAALARRLPGVSEAVVLDGGKAGPLGELQAGRPLRGRGYDLAIVADDGWRSAATAFSASIPLRRGYVGGPRFLLLNQMRPKAGRPPARWQAYAALAGMVGEATAAAPPPRLTVSPEAGREVAARLGLALDRPVAAIAPGARDPAKRWPAAHFAALAGRLAAEGFAVWIMGDHDDRALGEEIIRFARPPEGGALPVSLCCRVGLVEAADLIGLAAVAVGNDSGLVQVAGAAGRPVVVVYGPTAPAATLPATGRSRALAAPAGGLALLKATDVAAAAREIAER